MLFRFPTGYERHSKRAPGSIDEVRVLDGAAEVGDLPADKKVARGCSLVVRGWGFDPLAMAPAHQVIVTADDRFTVEALYGSHRPDIAENFKQKELSATGFKAIMPTGGLALAPHRLRLYVIDPDGSTYFETSSDFEFEVVPARQQIPAVPRTDPAAIHTSVDEIATMEGTSDAGLPLPKVTRGAILVVRGWAFDVERKMPCQSVFVTLGDECARAIYGVPREDVAQDQKVAAARLSGFTARVGTRSLAPGRHEIGLIGVASDGRAFSQTNYATPIEIVEPVAAR